MINYVGNQRKVLNILAGLVAPGGGIGVAAYGQLGRTGVFHVQEWLRLTGTEQAGGEPDGVKAARDLLFALPLTNWDQRNGIFAEPLIS